MERYRPTYILAAATPFRKAVAYSEFGHGLLTEAILEILGGSDTPNGDSSAGQLLSAKQLKKRLSSSATFFDTSPPSPVIFGLKRLTRETIPVQSRTPPFPGIGIAGDRNATALQPIIQSDSPRTIGRPWPNRGRPERERSRCFGNTPPSSSGCRSACHSWPSPENEVRLTYQNPGQKSNNGREMSEHSPPIISGYRNCP
jgi:hypothetical protein